MNNPRQCNDVNPSVPQVATGPGRGQAFQFSNEELRVLKECNRDSFFQRCIPIGTILGVATYYGVQAGHLKPSARWGAGPKVIVASILGYFIGKFSYQSKCAEKIMQIPDSKLAAILRQKKRGAGFQESLEPGIGHGMSLSPFSSMTPSDTYSDVARPQSSSIDLDTTRPDNSGLDDTHRPTLDNNPVYEEETMPVQQNKVTSYDELRQQNREDYQKQRGGVFKSVTSPAESPQIRRQPQVSLDKESSGSKRTNIYGDTME